MAISEPSPNGAPGSNDDAAMLDEKRLAEIASAAGISLSAPTAEVGALLQGVLGYCKEHGIDPVELAQHARSQAGSSAAQDRDRATKKMAIFASNFDPPSRYHRDVAAKLLETGFDEVVVAPSGPRPLKGAREHAPPAHRAALTTLAFRNMPAVTIDFSDLDDGVFTPFEQLLERHQSQGEIWLVAPAELLRGARERKSLLHARMRDGDSLWQKGRFIILHSASDAPDAADLPPNYQLLQVEHHVPSAELRSRVYAGKSIDEFVAPEVSRYIARHRLFLPFSAPRPALMTFQRPKLMIVFDERNDRAAALAKRYQSQQGDPPDLILVLGGDGTMLHAIRQHWRLRIPFLGLNTGNYGFLMNEALPENLDSLELVSHAMPMLRVDAETPEGKPIRGLAYGDAWIERADGQAAWLQLEIDGQVRVPKVVGDGMLVATPSGSSAYARAMGAVPVPLNTPVLTLTGSNIFQPRFWKPMALADTSEVRITSLDRTGKRPLRGFLDGYPMGPVQSMRIRKSSVAAAELAFTREFDPSGKLLRSLFPPVENF
jgi:NAD+ kinase